MSILGVTGSIGCGKTYACNMMQKAGGGKTSYVSVDELRRRILGTDTRYEEVRAQLVKQFGNGIQKADGSICGKELGQIIFYDTSENEAYRKIVYPSLTKSIEEAIQERNGLVLVEWACLVEDNLLPLVFGNTLVVTCDSDAQIQRLTGGDLPLNQIKRRIACQLSNTEKIARISEYQKQTGTGQLYVFDTTQNPGQEQYTILLEKIMKALK